MTLMLLVLVVSRSSKGMKRFMHISAAIFRICCDGPLLLGSRTFHRPPRHLLQMATREEVLGLGNKKRKADGTNGTGSKDTPMGAGSPKLLDAMGDLPTTVGKGDHEKPLLEAVLIGSDVVVAYTALRLGSSLVVHNLL